MVEGPAAFDEWPGEVNLLGRVLYGISVAELELPHIVCTRSRGRGETTYSGPYESGLMALAAAESEWRAEHESGGAGDLTFHVAALYPALQPEDLYPTAPASAPPLPQPRAPAPASLSASARPPILLGRAAPEPPRRPTWLSRIVTRRHQGTA
jgi:hypothetical protein